MKNLSLESYKLDYEPLSEQDWVRETIKRLQEVKQSTWRNFLSGFIAVALVLLPVLNAPTTSAQPIIPTIEPISAFTGLLRATEPIEPIGYAREELTTLKTLYIRSYGQSWPNTYAWGNCTWGVANWLEVPNSWGNANTWAYRAASQGYEVNNEPRVGSVAATGFPGPWGHVALVVNVSGSSVQVREMNFVGLGVTSYRWTHVSSWQFIHLN